MATTLYHDYDYAYSNRSYARVRGLAEEKLDAAQRRFEKKRSKQ